MTFAFQKAKVRWGLFCILQLLMVVVGASAPLIAVKFPVMITTVSFALAVSIMVMRFAALHVQGRAESLLRALRWFDSFGASSSEEIVRLLSETDTDPGRPGPADPHRAYYASNHEPGWERYAANCAESSHSTSEYARSMLWIMAIPVFAVVILALVLLFFAANVRPEDVGAAPAVGQIVPALLTALLVMPLGDAFYGYYNLRSKAKALFDTAIRKSLDECQLQLRAADYDAAISMCPPIPNWLYERKQAKLDEAWARLAEIHFLQAGQ